MSSIGAAEAASTHSTQVVSREALYTGTIVKVKVPSAEQVILGHYPSNDELIPYMGFCRFIPGGRVNLFVLTDDPDPLYGETITASASIMKKTLDNGLEYLYIDLFPVDRDTPVTHRLVVINQNEVAVFRKSDLVFPTPAPLRGSIILTSPDEKVVVKQTHLSTGDHELDRLVSQGWQVVASHAGTVTLCRGEGSARKTITHRQKK